MHSISLSNISKELGLDVLYQCIECLKGGWVSTHSTSLTSISKEFGLDALHQSIEYLKGVGS